MPKPMVGDNGSGMHVHKSISKDGKNLFAGDEYGRPFGNGVVLHRWYHQARSCIECNPKPIYKLIQAFGPHFEAPIMLAYSARNRSASIRIPYVSNPKR